jgi:hypothetical protein
MLQHKVDTGARAVEALVGQQEHMSQQLQDSAKKTAASIAGLSTVMSGSTRLQAANSRLEALQFRLPEFLATTGVRVSNHERGRGNGNWHLRQSHEHFNLTGTTWIICSA